MKAGSLSTQAVISTARTFHGSGKAYKLTPAVASFVLTFTFLTMAVGLFAVFSTSHGGGRPSSMAAMHDSEGRSLMDDEMMADALLEMESYVDPVREEEEEAECDKAGGGGATDVDVALADAAAAEAGAEAEAEEGEEEEACTEGFEVTCPSDLSVFRTEASFTPAALASEACQPVADITLSTVHPPGAPSPVLGQTYHFAYAGSYVLTYTATTANGTAASCEQIITVMPTGSDFEFTNDDGGLFFAPLERKEGVANKAAPGGSLPLYWRVRMQTGPEAGDVAYLDDAAFDGKAANHFLGVQLSAMECGDLDTSADDSVFAEEGRFSGKVSYDAASARWQYNVMTSKLWADYCLQLRVRARFPPAATREEAALSDSVQEVEAITYLHFPASASAGSGASGDDGAAAAA